MQPPRWSWLSAILGGTALSYNTKPVVIRVCQSGTSVDKCRRDRNTVTLA